MNNNFSIDEWLFLTQELPIKLKPGILNKLNQILSDTHSLLWKAHAQKLDKFEEWKGLNKGTGRIYKGENYLGLPWIALDCFSSYGKNKTLLFRILIVWGQGAFFNFFAEKNVSRIDSNNKTSDYSFLPVFISKSDDIWLQHIDTQQGVFITSPLKAKEIRDELGYTRIINYLPFSEMTNFGESAIKIFENQCLWMQSILQHPAL